MAWKPVLTGTARERATQATLAIAEDILAIAQAQDEVGLFADERYSLSHGQAGIALFFSYLSKAYPNQGYASVARRLLLSAIDCLARQDSVPSLFSGFTGVGWVTEHIREMVFPEKESNEDPCEEIASALTRHVSHSKWIGELDLISGLTGIGFYFLERKKHQDETEALSQIVDRFRETAVRARANSVTWKTPSHRIPNRELAERFPNGMYNLGVAHGVPGIISFLGEASFPGSHRDSAFELLTGAFQWLTDHRLSTSELSVYPYYVGPGFTGTTSRLAWCYGDPGVSAALLNAARRSGHSSLEAEALQVGRRAAKRRDHGSGVVDAGLCHGSVGLAHLFNRLYQATRSVEFRKAAHYWYSQALDFRTQGEGVGGFRWRSPGEAGWREDPGFLTGAAGIGLGFLGAVTDIEPKWDRCLAVGVPPLPELAETS